MSALLELKEISVRYPLHSGFFGRRSGWFTAVNQVSFSIDAGQCLGLVGESGCGKTTCSRAILGLRNLSSGSIYSNGRQIDFNNKQSLHQWRSQVQIIFQDPYSSLNPRMNVGDIIAEPLVNYKICSKSEAHKRVSELIQRVGLRSEHMQRYPHEFSGGQRQRIGIARALALKPKILICDEPVSSLDVSIQAQIINLLRELQQEFNLALLFISHDLAVVHHLADQIAVMKDSRIVETGSRTEIFQAAQNEYTQQLLAAVPQLPGLKT